MKRRGKRARARPPAARPRRTIVVAARKRNARSAGALRWNADPDDVRRAVARLVLTLADFIRQLLERQAIRRMEDRTLRPREVEAVGRALLELEKTLAELARQFDLDPEDLNLDLGPLGRLKP
jgi:hypothetical protein